MSMLAALVIGLCAGIYLGRWDMIRMMRERSDNGLRFEAGGHLYDIRRYR